MSQFGFKYAFARTDAVPPSRAHESDSGYDLTAVDIVKEYDDVKLYTTGIVVQPNEGWYFDLVPRSSVSKTGYMLANSVGIIDQSYRGQIMIALRKVNKEAPDLELPCKIAQLIPRRWYTCVPEEVPLTELIDTERGKGGFGSTTR